MLIKVFIALWTVMCSAVLVAAAGTESMERADQMFAYVFVGGVHQSGTSVVERLLSAQLHATGLQTTVNSARGAAGSESVGETSQVDLHSMCARISKTAANTCLAPENEGTFLTRTFQQCYRDRGTLCAPFAPGNWGDCAASQHLTEFDCLPQRRQLVRDWNHFWDKPSARYRIEKDISNLVKGRFLEQTFLDQSKGHTGFVFVLRHPMASCRDFQCNVRLHVEAWLKAYELMLGDLALLQHYIVLHIEHLTDSPEVFTKELQKFLAWDVQGLDIKYVNGMDMEPMEESFYQVAKKQRRIPESSGVVGGNDKNNNNKFRQPARPVTGPQDASLTFKKKQYKANFVKAAHDPLDKRSDPDKRPGIVTHAKPLPDIDKRQRVKGKPVPKGGRGYTPGRVKSVLRKRREDQVRPKHHRLKGHLTNRPRAAGKGGWSSQSVSSKRHATRPVATPPATQRSANHAKGGPRRKLMGFHGLEDQYQRGNYTVKLLQTAESRAWREVYAARVLQDEGVHKALVGFKGRLERLCYSVNSIDPINMHARTGGKKDKKAEKKATASGKCKGGPVFAKSAKNMPP